MALRAALLSFPAFAIAAGLAACSSSVGESPAGAKPSTGATGVTDGGADAGPSMLSNGCPVNSGYVGDDRCLPGPATTDGFQLHYGVAGEYLEPAVESPFVLQPGQ